MGLDHCKSDYNSVLLLKPECAFMDRISGNILNASKNATFTI